MVDISVSKRPIIPIRFYSVLGVSIICAIFTLASTRSSLFRGYISSINSDDLVALQTVNDITSSNSNSIKMLRHQLREQCENATSVRDVNQIAINQISGYIMPSDAIPKVHNSNNGVRWCKNVVMDFGANIGDTSGHVIDAGMIQCDWTVDSKAMTSLIHFNVETRQLETVKNLNKLTGHLSHLMMKNDHNQGPEDYCYYGIEGNPHFTERLQKLEDYVMAIQPRPVQHMHFFTESVGAGEDGRTKIYLDTINAKHNFWGSSILKDHQDVRKSADGNDVETVAAPVMGFTLGTLMRSTLKAFDPHAQEHEKSGGHFILKVDIEGGEYPLLHQAVDNGTLCEFVRLGNSADIFIEFHSQKVTGRHDYVGKTQEMKDALSKCGVTMGNLGADWA